MRRKEARVEVRMTEREKEILKRKAAKNGMTVSEYARKLLANSDDETIRVIDTEPLRMAAHELAKQGTNLNQFMRFLNSNGAGVFNQDEAKAVFGERGLGVLRNHGSARGAPHGSRPKRRPSANRGFRQHRE